MYVRVLMFVCIKCVYVCVGECVRALRTLLCVSVCISACYVCMHVYDCVCVRARVYMVYMCVK